MGNWAGGPQPRWNRTRLDTLYRILGDGWFSGKSVLELGCGHGEIGKELVTKGAAVTLTDGRQTHVDEITKEDGAAKVLDVDGEWSIDGKFDLVIHWGVLYHVKEWKKSLESSLKHAPLLALETIVSKSIDPLYEEHRDEVGYDQALKGVGVLLSEQHIEGFLTSINATFERYDDPQLNTEACANYSWSGDEKVDINWRRRFWIVRRGV